MARQHPVLGRGEWLTSSGTLAERIRELDWGETGLGPRDRWPRELRDAVKICVESRTPIIVYWGPRFHVLYNDAFLPIAGNKHPAALGRPACEVWAEIWDQLGPLIEGVWTSGCATGADDRPFHLVRQGFTEECYFSYSLSPVRDDGGRVCGIFTPVTETTRRFVGERRLRMLRELSARTADAADDAEAVRLVAEVLATDPSDIPFAALYLMAADFTATLAATVALTPDSPAAPRRVEADAPDPWQLRATARSGARRIVPDAPSALPGGRWPEPARQAVSLPFAASGGAARGVLVAGVSPRLALDDDYQGFLDLVGSGAATALARAHARQEASRQAERLAELDRAKTAFFSNVSHEFRTPLTLMLGPLDDVLDDELSPALRESLTVVRRNGQRLLKLVNTLLDFSRLEAGRLHAQYEPVDVAAVACDLASVFRPAIERAGLAFDVECEPLRSPVHLDRDMFEKIVMNLLSNALKYTERGRVTLRLRDSDDGAVLTVSDTGIGIPAVELPRLFNRFHRVEGARGRTHEGSGIGLALVAELTRLHGGSVSVESREGEGSTFTVRLPYGHDHLPADRLVPPTAARRSAAAAAFVEEAERWLPDRDPRARRSAAARPGVGLWQDADGERPTILLADDNADMRHYVGTLLEDGCEVVRVADGAAALAAVQERRPDLIITDVMMPNMDGFALLRALRAEETTAALPVILLSARAGEEARLEGLEAGADDYLVKPFSARELIARVSGVLARAAARREAARTLRESEQRFRYMADNAPVMVRVTEADARCSFLSRSWYDFTGQPLDGALGFGWIEATHPDDRDATEAALLEANARRQPFRVEYRLRRHDGDYRWALDTAVPRVGVDGEHLGLVGSIVDITDRKEAETRRERLLVAERDARVEAERVNRMKDEFLTTLSHELRTPLNAILGWAQVIDRDGAAPADIRRGLAAINRNARAQTQMIEDLLDMSRIVSGKIRLEILPIHLADVIDEAVQSALPSAAARGLRLERVIESGPDTVAGDASRLQQVFWNLLTNAIKFTPKGGRVTVRLAAVDGCAEVSVRDTGEGMDPALIPHLFERFRQADATTTRRLGGLGLGLSIVKDLVELHGGTVRAESPGPGRGATLTVSLPLADPAAPAAGRA